MALDALLATLHHLAMLGVVALLLVELAILPVVPIAAAFLARGFGAF
jgi:uncharacterized membrane protein